jgi:hypothetical protein
MYYLPVDTLPPLCRYRLDKISASLSNLRRSVERANSCGAAPRPRRLTKESGRKSPRSSRVSEIARAEVHHRVRETTCHPVHPETRRPEKPSDPFPSRHPLFRGVLDTSTWRVSLEASVLRSRTLAFHVALSDGDFTHSIIRAADYLIGNLRKRRFVCPIRIWER